MSSYFQPISNLTHCYEALKAFHDKQRVVDEGVPQIKIIELYQALIKAVDTDSPDMAVLIKLTGMKLADFLNTKTQVRDMKNNILQKAHMLLEFVRKGVMPARFNHATLLNMTVKKLDLLNKFENIDSFLHFVKQRVKSRPKLLDRENELNRIIRQADDGPDIEIENLVDDAVPSDFHYVSKYYSDTIVYSEEAVVHCDCEDCHTSMQLKHKDKKCCVIECYRMPYNREGTLLLEPQQPIYECNPKCRCGDDCPFKVVSRGRQYRLGIFRTDNNRGWGLKALEKIPKGKFVITYMGELISIDVAEARNDEAHKKQQLTYMLDLDYNPDHEALFCIDAEHHGNIARYINHCVSLKIC